MKRFFLGMAILALAPASAQAQTLTPAGPATLQVGYGQPVACPAIARSEVLVKWQAQVGAGGASGTVRPVFGDVVGDPVTLPAEAGTYTFPAPHIPWSTCPADVGLIQETGGHAIVAAESTGLGRRVVVKRSGQADEQVAASHLTVTSVFEPDRDRDLRGDTTEDRTDLTVAAAPTRDGIGRLKVALTVTNAGPLPADLPLLTATAARQPRWADGGCTAASSGNLCVLSPLAPGESRTMTFFDDAPGVASAGFTLTAEGADLNGLNNQAAFAFGPAQAFALSAAAEQRLSRGIKLTVTGAAQQRARVTVAFTVRGRTIKLVRTVALAATESRALTLRPTGAKRRALRAAAGRKPLRARITVSTPAGKTPVSTRITVAR
jgi:hypothetical protein